MQVLLLVCAESVALDQRRNTMSLFHVIEEWNIPAIPAVIPYMVIVGLFERRLDEPDVPDNIQLHITLANQELFRGPFAVHFQGRLRVRNIIELGGLVIPNPGELAVRIMMGDRQMATWRIVVNHIGQPVTQPHLPLRTN